MNETKSEDDLKKTISHLEKMIKELELKIRQLEKLVWEQFDEEATF